MCLSTHRITQPSSRDVRDLLSKPLTQESKHCWTRLEYIYRHQWGFVPVHASTRDGMQPACTAHTFMNSFICFFSMRFWSSRCSFCVSLHVVSFQKVVAIGGERILIHDVRLGVCDGDGL